MFSPDEIPGGVLWLKADAISGLSDADPVATWEDAFASGNDASQSTSGSRPTYRTGVLNSLPVLRFDGSDDHLTLSDLMNGQAAGTGFFVAKLDADPPASASTTGPVLGDWGSDTVQPNNYPWVDGVVYEDFGTDTRKTCGDPTASLAAWHIGEMVSAAADWRCYINGTQLHATTSNTVGWNASPRIGSTGEYAAAFDGDLAEVIVYPQALSTKSRQRVEGYLAHKYAITSILPSDHPYKATPPGFEAGEVSVTQYTTRTVSLSWTPAVGATGSATQELQRSPSGAGTWSAVTEAESSELYTDSGLTPDIAYDYRLAATDDNETVYSEIVTVTPTGYVEWLPTTIIGSTGSLDDDPATEKAAAFDDDLTTYYEAANATGDWCGIDLGSGNDGILRQIRYAPPVLETPDVQETRIVGLKFQASNDASFSTGVVDLYTVPEFPSPVGRQLTAVDIYMGGVSYRYFRALSATFGRVSLAELRFFGEDSGADARPIRPTITPWGGRFPDGSRVVTITSESTTASYYYTTDGSDPDNTDTLYDGPFELAISGTVTLKAVAYDASLSTPLSLVSSAEFRDVSFEPDVPWYDDEGRRLQVNAGGIRYYNGRYWWMGFGNNRYTVTSDITFHYAVNLYSGTDLRNWRYEGQILPMVYGRVYRTDFLFNPSTNKYVMWGNVAVGGGVQKAFVATSDNINSGWTYFSEPFIPLSFDGYWDNSLFLDDDGTAYAVFNDATNSTIILELDADFTGYTGNYVSLQAGDNREAQQLAKISGGYRLFTSVSNYYDVGSPFDPEVASGTGSTPLTATWGTSGNLISPDPTGTLYNSQVGMIVAPVNKTMPFWAGDRWHLRDTYPGGEGLYDSTQVWLPFTDSTATALQTPTGWDLSDLTDLFTPAVLVADGTSISWTAASGSTGITEQIQRRDSFYGDWQDVSGATTSPYTDSSQVEGVVYDYRVASTDGSGDTVWSNEETVIAGASETGLTAGTLSESDHDHDSVDLSWTAATNNTGTVAEQLQRSANGADSWANVSGATSSPATDSTVSASTAYDYRVSYTDDAETVYSNTVTVTTDAAPVALSAGAASFVSSGRAGISVDATAPSGGTGAGPTYQWERNEDGGAFADLTGETSLTLDDDTATTEGVLYGFRCKQTRGAETVTTNTVTAQVYVGGLIDGGIGGVPLIGGGLVH